MSQQSEGERERESNAERFRYTSENTIDFLTFISSIKKNEVYKNQIHGQQDKKVREQFNDLQQNSSLFSEMSLSTYKSKMVEVFNAATIVYQTEKFKNLGEGTSSFVSVDANWSEFYETLPFKVKLEDVLDRERVFRSIAIDSWSHSG